MKPLRAIYLKNSESLINCYCFQIDYFNGSQRLLINMNKRQAYFLDENLMLNTQNQAQNFFDEEWAQELIGIFTKHTHCQKFEYSFANKLLKVTHSDNMLFNLFSSTTSTHLKLDMNFKPF